MDCFSSMNSVRMMWWTTMSRTFDILCNDTEFVFNNMGFQAYGTHGGDRAVLLRIMQIVAPHAWCLLTYMKSQSKNNRIPVNIAVVCRAQISAPKCRYSNFIDLRILESVDGPRQNLDQRSRATAVGLRVTSSRLVSPARCCWDAFGLPPICFPQSAIDIP